MDLDAATKEAKLAEYRAAREELAMDLQMYTLLVSAPDSVDKPNLTGTLSLACKRLLKSRGRYENAVNAAINAGE
ncbi:hypothetical protein HUW63_08340 [Myxococcus sp. AM001]|nr:hypothetical protein [Myxococcus sp. AM001]